MMLVFNYDGLVTTLFTNWTMVNRFTIVAFTLLLIVNRLGNITIYYKLYRILDDLYNKSPESSFYIYFKIMGFIWTNIGNPRPVYWPWNFLGSPLTERNASFLLLVRIDKRMKMCGKALGVSWWIESPGKFIHHYTPYAFQFWMTFYFNWLLGV